MHSPGTDSSGHSTSAPCALRSAALYVVSDCSIDRARRVKSAAVVASVDRPSLHRTHADRFPLRSRLRPPGAQAGGQGGRGCSRRQWRDQAAVGDADAAGLARQGQPTRRSLCARRPEASPTWLLFQFGGKSLTALLTGLRKCRTGCDNKASRRYLRCCNRALVWRFRSPHHFRSKSECGLLNQSHTRSISC